MARKPTDAAPSPIAGKSLILDVVQQHPGLTFRDILERLRQMGIDTQAHFNHPRSALAGLVLAGDLQRQRDGMISRLQPLDAAEKAALLAARRAARKPQQPARAEAATRGRRRGRPAKQAAAVGAVPAAEALAVPEAYVPPHGAAIEAHIRFSAKPLTRSALYHHFEALIPFPDINLALEYGLAEGFLLFGTQHALETQPLPDAEANAMAAAAVGVAPATVRQAPQAATGGTVSPPRVMLDAEGWLELTDPGQRFALSPVHALKVLIFMEKVKPALLQALPSEVDEGWLETLTRPD